jgi:hypothetical protein
LASQSLHVLALWSKLKPSPSFRKGQRPASGQHDKDALREIAVARGFSPCN